MLLPIVYEGEGRDGYRDQIVTSDVGVSLNSKTHPLFMNYSNGTSTQCYAYHYPSLFPVLFLQSHPGLVKGGCSARICNFCACADRGWVWLRA